MMTAHPPRLVRIIGTPLLHVADYASARAAAGGDLLVVVAGQLVQFATVLDSEADWDALRPGVRILGTFYRLNRAAFAAAGGRIS